MRKLCAISILIAMLITLAACSTNGTELATPGTTDPSENEAASTPEPYAPMDIFSSEFNLYGEMDIPDTLTVFAASFNKSAEKAGGKAQFVLSMTGSGNMFAAIAYQADVAGLGLDEGEKFDLLDAYRNNGGFCEFVGADGRVVTIRQADPNDDRYAYVTSDGSHEITGGGCVIEITYQVDDADIEKYTKLVRDNYDTAALASIAGDLDVETDFSECGITVSLHKNEASAYVVYDVTDVDKVQQSIAEHVEGHWWEWNGMMQTSIPYGTIESKLTFDNKGGAITIEQKNTELDFASGGYEESEVSLAKLGFGFDEAGVCGVYEVREPYYRSVAIHRPEWGTFADDWNIEYMDVVNGYNLRITYHESEGRYHISVEKDGTSCAYDTYPAKDEVGGEYPDLETVHQMFNDAFGTKEKELYHEPLALFEQFVQARFGMSIDALYALPKQ